MTVGGFLADRLVELGVEHFFSVPGDYNLALLDQFLLDGRLTMVGCCNELNAGYAADGYARVHGVAVVVTTFSVGALSALNAIAGAYAEQLPVILISGGPNTESVVEHETLHHTIGGPHFDYQRQVFEHVTAAAVTVDCVEDAAARIDGALAAALSNRRPAYIEIAANLAAHPMPAPAPRSFRTGSSSDPRAVAATVDAVAEHLDRARKPVLVAGGQLRSWGATDAFLELADATGYAVAAMPDAKGMFNESHPSFIGTYWGPISSPGVAAAVESADAYLFAGPVFTDYTTAGHSVLLSPDRIIDVGPQRTKVGGSTFTGASLVDVLRGVAGRATRNTTSRETFRRTETRRDPAPSDEADSRLTTRQLAAHVEAMLTADTTLVAETGDSWFNATRMRLPDDCGYHVQMKYGSIGWSVGAALGCSMAHPPDHTVIALVGDGSFQMTAQEVSTMIRHGRRIILFVVNNAGYTIEVEIHDGPYNDIQNWHYAELAHVFGAGGGAGQGTRVSTEHELEAAIANASAFDGVSLIECIIDRNDCTDDLLEWGSRVLANNSRPPHDHTVL